MTLSCENILDRMAVPNHKNVFYIGRGAAQVSLLAQQYRAFNLIWSLKRERDLGIDSKVAVIGAGLAGITAALSAHLSGAQVSIIEEKPEPMHLQRGSRLRYIHPYVATWPFSDSNAQITDLPILNWSAGHAAFVSETIIQQWDYFTGAISQFYNHEVTDISCFDGGCNVSAQNRLNPLINEENHQTARYDYVIIAVGFGLERDFANVPALSYWENDNLSQPVITGKLPRRYLISGCGDGGLIDATRLSLTDFDHGRFTNLILSSDELGDVKEKLKSIERSARDLLKSESIRQRAEEKQQLSQGRSVPTQSILESITGQYLTEQYGSLEIPESIEKEVRRSMRTDTEVILNGRGVTPLRLDAFIFNRFAVHLLRRWGHLQYRQGDLSRVEPKGDGSFTAIVTRPGFEEYSVSIDQIVIRHGPKTTLNKLFSKEVVSELTATVDENPDPLASKQFTDDFLKHSLLDELKRQVALRHAANNFLDMCQNRSTPANLIEAGVQVSGNSVSYKLRDSTIWSDTRSAFLDMPILLQGPTGRSFVQVTHSKTPLLAPSIEIGVNAGKEVHVRSICCFVCRDDESSQASMLLPGISSAKKGDSVIDLADKTRKIGTITDVSTLEALPPGSSATDTKAPSNDHSYCLASIEESQKYDTDIHFLTRTIKIPGVRHPKVGLRICRYVNDSLVYARVVATGARVPITSADGSTHLYRNVTICELEVESSPTSALAGGASFDENGYIVGVALGANPKHWLEAPVIDFLSGRGMVLCSSVDIEFAKRELLLRALEFKKGKLVRHKIFRNSGIEVTDYLSVGDCFYYLEEHARLTVLAAFEALKKDKLIDFPAGADIWKLTPSGFAEAKRLANLENLPTRKA